MSSWFRGIPGGHRGGLVYVIAILLALVTVAVTIASYQQELSNLIQVAYLRMGAVASLETDNLRQWDVGQERTLTFVARHLILPEFDFLHSRPRDNDPRLVRLQAEIRSLMPQIMWLTVEAVDSSMTDSRASTGRKSPIIDGSRPAYEPSRPVIIMRQQVYDSRGILRGRVEAGVAYEIPSVGAGGAILLFPDAASDRVLVPPGGVREESVPPAIARGQRDGQAVYRTVNGIPVLGLYRWLPDFASTIVIEVPQFEVFAVASEAGKRIALTGLFVLLITMGTLWFAGRSQRRLLAVLARKAVEAAGTENPDPIGAGTFRENRELLSIVDAYNSVIERLRTLRRGNVLLSVTAVAGPVKFLLATDASGVIVYAGATLAELGLEPRRMIGRPVVDFLRSDSDTLGSGVLRVQQGERDEWKDVEIAEQEIADRDGEALRVISLHDPSTNRSEADDPLMRKLELLAELGGNITHDFNNLLAGVLGNLTLLRMEYKEGDPEYDQLSRAVHGVLRVRDLSQQLLAFSDGRAISRRRTSLRPLVDGLIELMQPTTACTFSIAFVRDLPDLDVDEELVSQAVYNVLLNATECMPDGGDIHVHADREGRWVRLMVHDHGPGIPPQERGRIFEPYFTTRPGKQGLGLSVAYAAIRRHGGRIEVDSTVGDGSTFRLWLPAYSPESGA